MRKPKRVHVLGAGFSRPAGMPLATELLDPIKARLNLGEMTEWLDDLQARLRWLSGEERAYKLNIEEVFHYAQFDMEAFRLKQHLARVGRKDGPGTFWGRVESIEAWLQNLESELIDVLDAAEEGADIDPIARWAEALGPEDAVITFNYDALVERAIEKVGREWNHGTMQESNRGTAVHKLHGSIDWVVVDRKTVCPKNCVLLFEKENLNAQPDERVGSIEDDCRLLRFKTRTAAREWINGRDLQVLSDDARVSTIGMAGLGAYKRLHEVPGLGYIWSRAMGALRQADQAIVLGFAMSDFDKMAQLHFAEVAKARARDKRPLRVVLIDPNAGEEAVNRFQRVFRWVTPVRERHEQLDWSRLHEYGEVATD